MSAGSIINFKRYMQQQNDIVFVWQQINIISLVVAKNDII